MRTTFLVALAGLAAAVTTGRATAQRLLAYDPFASMVTELQPPDAVLFTPNPPILIYPTAPILPPPIAAIPTPGDGTFDNAGGVHWFTDGMILAPMPSPSVPPVGPVGAPFPIAPAVMGAIGGPVTGIAIDGAAGVMWMTSVPGIIVGVAPVPGTPVVVPPFPLPFPAGPIAGLEWDGATGSLWAVSVGGVAYNVFPGGAPAGPPLPSVVPPPGPVGDIAIDKMAKLNGFGFRPLYLTAGGMVFDMTDPGAPLFPSGGPVEGLSFANHPIHVGPLGGCASCPTMAGPTNFITGPMTSGNAGFGLGMTGMIPGSFCVFGFDTVYSPLFPTVNVVGCPLGLTVSPTLLLFLSPVDATGTAVFPLSLAAAPVGVTLYNQGFTFCSADPTGFVFSPFQALTIGGL